MLKRILSLCLAFSFFSHAIASSVNVRQQYILEYIDKESMEIALTEAKKLHEEMNSWKNLKETAGLFENEEDRAFFIKRIEEQEKNLFKKPEIIFHSEGWTVGSQDTKIEYHYSTHNLNAFSQALELKNKTLPEVYSWLENNGEKKTSYTSLLIQDAHAIAFIPVLIIIAAVGMIYAGMRTKKSCESSLVQSKQKLKLSLIQCHNPESKTLHNLLNDIRKISKSDRLTPVDRPNTCKNVMKEVFSYNEHVIWKSCLKEDDIHIICKDLNELRKCLNVVSSGNKKAINSSDRTIRKDIPTKRAPIKQNGSAIQQ